MGTKFTNSGIKVVLDRLVNDSANFTAASRFYLGQGQTEPTVSSTGLVQQVPIYDTTSVDDCETPTNWAAGTDTGTSANSTTYLEGAGALNVTKTGTSGTSATVSATVTSNDFTSNDLWLDVYVKDSTTLAYLSGTPAAVVRFGSDSSNYYEYQVNKTSFSTGWNLLGPYNNTNYTGTSGSPVDASSDYAYLSLWTTGTSAVWSAGDVVVDDWRLAGSTDYFRTTGSGYPVGPGTSGQVEIRTTFIDTDALGADVNGAMIANSDATPEAIIVTKFLTISKGVNEQITISGKIRGRQTDS